MPEELEIGKILIGVRVVLGNALEALNKAKSTMKDMAQAGTAAQKDVKSVGTAFQSAAQGSKSMNTALAQTEKQLDDLDVKINKYRSDFEEYNKKVRDTATAYNEQKQKIIELTQALLKKGRADVQENPQKYDGLSEKEANWSAIKNIYKEEYAALNKEQKKLEELHQKWTKYKTVQKELADKGNLAIQQETKLLTVAEKQLNAVNQKAAETKTTLSGTGAQTENIDKYTVKIEELTTKLEYHERKVEDIYKEIDKNYERFYETCNYRKALGENWQTFANNSGINEEARERLDIEINKVNSLRKQIALTQQARDEAANKAALSAQKQADAAEKAAERETQAMAKMEERQKRADSTLALSSMAMMMNTVANASDGLAGKLSTVASQVIFLKQALNAAASPAAKLGTAFAGGLGIAVSIFTALASEAQRLREESIKSAAEAAQAYVSSEKEIKTLEKNISILESYNSTTEEVKKAKQELAEMSPSMIAGYDKEGETVLKTVDALKKELEYRKLLADEKLNAASDSAEINIQQYYENIKKIEALERLKNDAYSDVISDISVDGTKRNISRQQTQDIETVYGTWEATFQGLFKSSSERFRNDLQEVKSQNEKILEDSISGLRAKITELCKGDTTISDAFDDLFFIDNLKPEIIDPDNLDVSIQALIDQYDQIMEKVDEELRNQIFDQDTAPEIVNVFHEKIEGAFGLVGDQLEEKIKEIQEEMKGLLSGDIMGDVSAFNNLAEKITGGEATMAEMNRYDTLLQKIINTCNESKTSFQDLTNTANKNSAQLRKAAAEAKGANSSYIDLAKGTSELFASYKNLNKEMSEINVLKAVIKTLKEGKSSKNYGDALAYIADMYGVSEDKAADMLGTLEAETQTKEVLAAATVLLTQVEIENQIMALQSAKSQAESMNSADTSTAKSIQNMIDNLIVLQEKMAETFNLDGTPKISADLSKIKIPRSGGSGKKSGGGGGSKSNQNTALDNELKRLEHKKAMDDLTYSEELAWLQRIRSKYAKTAEEKQELDEKVYSAKKALLEAEREHAKNMDRLTLQEEIASLESQMRLYRSGTQARMELEEQLYQAKKDLERQVYDLNVYYGKLNLEEQAKQIEKMISKYKEGTQACIDLEKELYDIQQQIKERDTESINKVAEGITEALRNRYEQQRDAEQQRIEESKKSWQEWSDAQVKAIQEQMDALDDLTKQEDQAEEERKRRRKISAMEQAIQYESDDYNRRQLAEQLETAKKDLEDYLKKIDRDNQKEALRAEQERIKEQAEKEQELLDEEWKTKSKEYEEFLKEFNLKAEAEKMLMKGNQEEILDIIKSYAPEYDMAGQTLGEKLVDGFSSKVTDIQAWIDSLTEPIREQQRLMAIVATEAADNFMRRQREREAAGRAQAEQPRQISLTVNVNKEIATPYELRCELERMIENISDL